MTIDADRLATVFVEIADTLVDEFDLIEFVQMVTSRTSELVDAAAAGLLLADGRGDLQFMAASDEPSELLELFQVQARQGPCQDAFRTGVPVVNSDLRAAAGRWPLFAPRAVDAGYLTVHAFPLRLRSEVIGALNIFGTDTRPMRDQDAQIVQALADVATIGLLQERTVRDAERLSAQLQIALDSRVVIEQAKGAVAEIYGISIDESFHRLRSYARRNGLRLGDVARTVLGDPRARPDLR